MGGPWPNFGSILEASGRPFCLPKSIKQIMDFLEGFWKHFGSIFQRIVFNFTSFLSYHFGTFVKKAEPTNSQPLPMKSEVRALEKDTKIDPKCDQNLDKNRV